jgi:hypothetical protein
LSGKNDEFVIYGISPFYINIADSHGDSRIFLELGEDLQSTTPALAAEVITRIGDVLQFVEHEAGDEEFPGEEPGSGDVCHPSIDDDTGIE